MGLGAWAQTPATYTNSFDTAELGKAPAGMLVLGGDFAVREDAGNRVLELPGDPLDSFGILFGPTVGEDTTVTARVFGTGKGRRFPAFGIGLNGLAGYRLMVSPGKKEIELLKGEVDRASEPFHWQSGKWTHLRLALRKVQPGQWRVEGKVWVEGEPEPSAWTIGFDETEAPRPGRPGLYGSPFAGTPIRYDDLFVQPVETR